MWLILYERIHSNENKGKKNKKDKLIIVSINFNPYSIYMHDV